jgi:hypothetical protein
MVEQLTFLGATSSFLLPNWRVLSLCLPLPDDDDYDYDSKLLNAASTGFIAHHAAMMTLLPAVLLVRLLLLVVVLVLLLVRLLRVPIPIPVPNYNTSTNHNTINSQSQSHQYNECFYISIIHRRYSLTHQSTYEQAVQNYNKALSEFSTSQLRSTKRRLV